MRISAAMVVEIYPGLQAITRMPNFETLEEFLTPWLDISRFVSSYRPRGSLECEICLHAAQKTQKPRNQARAALSGTG